MRRAAALGVMGTGVFIPSQPHIRVLCRAEELYGDFEDLETGEVHKSQSGQEGVAEVACVMKCCFITEISLIGLKLKLEK